MARDTNNDSDIFVRDRRNGSVRRASISQIGAQANDSSYSASITPDGRYVAFFSYASNLVSHDTNAVSDVFLRDLKANTTSRVSVGANFAQSNGESDAPSISADGNRVTFESDAALVASDTNGQPDLYLRDRRARTTRLLSIGLGGRPANGEDFFFASAISQDGSAVVFNSRATNLVHGDTNSAYDVFVASP